VIVNGGSWAAPNNQTARRFVLQIFGKVLPVYEALHPRCYQQAGVYILF
jgi:hypothetical protein